VITGVVVHDNVAYAVAGYQKDNGVHAYAIDPGTGNVLWEKDDAGLPEPGRLWYGMDSFGNVAVDAGRLWLAAPQHGSFDLKSGTWKCNPGASAGGREAMGSEVAVFGGRWVVQGGSRLSETQGDIARQENAGFSAYPVEKFAASYGPATWVGGGIALPAWDAELCVLLAGRYVEPRPSASLSGVPMARMEAWFEKRFAQPKATAADSQAKPQEWSELSAWSITNLASLAFVLAKDQLVVAHGTGKTGYKISGFKRSDGSQTWSVDLPEPPAANRLAIDRDGRILLTLCDGSVLCIGRKEQT
jgi:outer membrane protein assembly factor BamB